MNHFGMYHVDTKDGLYTTLGCTRITSFDAQNCGWLRKRKPNVHLEFPLQVGSSKAHPGQPPGSTPAVELKNIVRLMA
jgi:hypothetical protein